MTSSNALAPVVLLLNTLRVRRLIRTPTERFFLFMDNPNRSDYIWWFQLAQPCLLFLYLSHVAGCLFWYVSVLELEYGLRQETPNIVWPDTAQEYLPPLSYAGCAHDAPNLPAPPLLSPRPFPPSARARLV